MIILNKDNILSYIKKYAPKLILNDPVTVNVIGDGDLDKDVEGDGYCNYIYRVSDGEHSYIIKQATAHLKRRGKPMDPSRNRYEYEIMQLRGKIVPEYVPKLYMGDFDNNIFIMEDVSYLRLIRYQLTKNHIYPKLSKQVAHYLAATHFYTSEFYLETGEFRDQLCHFMGTQLRVLMENLIFLNIFGADNYDPACGPEFKKYCEEVRFDDYLQLQRYKLRHIFMTKSETLIHGDFHTSNIFADDENMKVIDMEYTFAAPFSYDLGFIIANILSQFCSAAFRPYLTESKRRYYMSYLLSIIEMIYRYYIAFFFEYWDKDAKLEYRIDSGYKEDVALTLLRESFGFAACVNFSRVMGYMDTIDYDSIKDSDARTAAKYLSVDIDACFLRKWDSYTDIRQPIEDMIELMKKRTEFTLF